MVMATRQNRWRWNGSPLLLLLPVFLVLVFLVFGAPRPALAGPVEDCLAETGLAFRGGQSVVQAGDEVEWAFGSPNAQPVYCDPPDADRLALTAGSGAAELRYLGGVGALFSTKARSQADALTASRGQVELDLLYGFRVTRDDPQSALPVPFVIQLDYLFRPRLQAIGTGFSENNAATTALIRRDSPTGAIVKTLYSGALPATSNSIITLFLNADLPVETDLYLVFEWSQESYADSGNGSGADSSSASVETTFTFAATPLEDADIEFDFESRLGLAPPTIGVVPEPGFAASLALMSPLLLRFKKRRMQQAPDASAGSSARTR